MWADGNPRVRVEIIASSLQCATHDLFSSCFYYAKIEKILLEFFFSFGSDIFLF